MKRVLCLWFPNWPIQRLLAADPKLQQRSVVLYADEAGRGQRVAACSERAREWGIGPGMPLSEAYSLSQHGTGGLHRQPYAPLDDRAGLEDLAVACETFSPLVGLEEGDAPESLLLDVTGLAHLFDGEAGLARQIDHCFSARQYQVRIAVADTLAAAWAAAHFLTTPNRPAILAPGRHERLFSLPLAALRLTPATADILRQLGMQRITELVQLSRASLKARLGPEVLRRLDQLTGRSPEPIIPHRRLPEFAERWVFEHATTNTAAIEQVLSHLLDQLTAGLRSRQLGVLELASRFELEGAPPLALHLGLYDATADPLHLLNLLQLQLERQRFAAAVSVIVVRAEQTAPLAWRQCELFADAAQTDPRQLSRLINQLSSRLGRDAVVRPRLRPDSVPERAVKDVPLAGQTPLRKPRARRSSPAGSQGENPSPRWLPHERPLCLLPRPVRIDVIAALPDGPPAVFFYDDSRHDISACWGPERIETAWWRGPFVRRDYYRTETTSGRRFWLFRCLRKLHWFLHGEFC